MPRISDRAKAIAYQQSIVDNFKEQFIAGLDDDDNDSVHEVMYRHHYKILEQMKSKRYFFRSNKYRKRKVFDFDDCISVNSTEYNNTEFLYMFRLQRESFLKLVDLIKDDTVFEPRPFKQARPVHHQLLVFLYRIGREGVAASLNAMSTFFKIGKGSIRNYILNCIKAILKLKKCYLLAISDGT